MTRAFHKFWLKITALAIAGFSPVFFLGTIEATVEPARLTMDILSWPLDGASRWAEGDTRFLSAITAGIMLGWGALIWCLRAWVYDAAPEGVRKSVLVSAIAWYLLDGLGSVTSGNSSNLIFNTALLLVAIGPMWRPAIEDRTVQDTIKA